MPLLYRFLARVVATVHATVEVAIVLLLVAGPLPWATGALVLVGVPMLVLRGRCWVTDLERALRRRGGEVRWKSPSMTRRLIYWCTLGRVSLRDTKRAQWWLIGGVAALWLVRVGVVLMGS